mgnify:FL=1|jgi:hypothetical protein|nr:DUF58 domain-containing protein [uncultured Lachnoclostridium sp.]
MVRAKIGYFLVVFFLGLLSILYDEYIMMFVFLTVFMISVLLWIIMLYVRKFVDISLTCDSSIVQKGTPYQMVVRITNRSIFPVSLIRMNLSYQNQFEGIQQEEKMIAIVDSSCEQSHTFTMTSDYCGILQFSLKHVKFYDFLGLWCVRKKNKEELTVTVLPNIHVIEESLVLDNPSVLIESELFSATQSGDDVSVIFGLKDYEYGDKMNRIHWKLSLKEDKLMVKQYGLPINCSVAIFFDTHFNINGIPSILPIEYLDRMMETMVSLSFSMITQKQIHFLVWQDPVKDICKRFRIENEEDLYEILAILFSNSRLPQEKSLAVYHEAQYSKEQYTNIFYLAGMEIRDATQAMVRSRKNAWTHFIYMQNNHTESVALEQGMTASFLSADNLYMELRMLPGEWRGK